MCFDFFPRQFAVTLFPTYNLSSLPPLTQYNIQHTKKNPFKMLCCYPFQIQYISPRRIHESQISTIYQTLLDHRAVAGGAASAACRI